MSTNLSKRRREKLLNNIKIMREKLKENADLVESLADIESELQEKRYGLIWEEHEERVDEEIKTQIPVFIEERELEIKSDKNNPINFLIEGDNLHSLYLLEKTHAGKIDVIYIDPPYNTGNRDFIYDDNFVIEEDSYKHSKWLSFMKKRLELANSLLSDKGVIFISIDDNEFAQLKLLCDDIFRYDNCIGILPTIMNLKGNQDQFGFAGTHEYTIVFAKDKSKVNIGQFNIEEEEVEKEWEIDNVGYYKKGATLKATGADSAREKRPFMFYPVLIKDKEIFMIKEMEYSLLYDRNSRVFNDKFLKELVNKYEQQGYEVLLPTQTNGSYGRWRWSFDNMLKNKNEIIINTVGGYSLYKKQRPSISDIPTKKPKSLFYKPEYSSGNGTNQVVNIFGNKIFNNPKPVELLKDFILIGLNNKKNGIVLDFFAGSGTTGQAVMELNKEDGGSRKYILCTNNENNICKEITYERMKRVINGYTDIKGKKIEGLGENLKYYKTEYIERFNRNEDGYYIINELSKYIKELVQLENGIDINNTTIQVLFTDEEIDKFLKDVELLKKCNTVYVDTNALITDEQMKIFEKNNIKVLYIPEYYFEDEIMEVEQW